MSRLAKVIAILIILLTLVSTAYTVNFAKEYTASLSALADFEAYAEIDADDMKYSEDYDIYYFIINVTFVNPSDTHVGVYEVNLAAFLMNESTGDFRRIGNPTSCFCEFPPKDVPPNSEARRIFFLVVDDPDDLEWNAEKSPDGKALIDIYMEVRFEVLDGGFVSMYAFGMPHSPCPSCGGRGPFE